MTAHDHSEVVNGCFRCELGRDELGVSGPQLDTRKLSVECHEEVTRRGELQPCEKPAVAVRIDPNEGSPYAVCAYHCRAPMVPLGDLITAAWRS